VFALGGEYQRAQIIITADVHDERAKVIQHHYPTTRLNKGATLKDVLWELNLLFPSGSKLINSAEHLN
jgi:hypothetical protein